HSRSTFISKSPPPTDTSTLSLHDALPISTVHPTASSTTTYVVAASGPPAGSSSSTRTWSSRMIRTPSPTRSRRGITSAVVTGTEDRKSTRLNSSHQIISYAVFSLKKKTTE